MFIKKFIVKVSASLLFLCILTAIPLLSPRIVDTANLTDTRDTLETSRLSFSSALEGAHTAGSSIVTIDTANYPSTTTNNLHAGDEVYIGISASNPYTISDVIDSDEFTLTNGLGAADADNDDPIYVKRDAQHVITFTTASAVANGSFRVRLPIEASNYNDGYPDDAGFDMNSIAVAHTTAPEAGNGYTFTTPSLGVGGTCPSNYVCFYFPYTGSGGASIGFTGPSGNDFRIGNVTTSMLNPAPASGHAEGTADTYTAVIENLDAGGTAIDSTSISIGVIESVRVTATVDPSITFTLASRAAGSTACGVASNATTSVYSVPFGSLTLNTFRNAAQSLTISTNAASGYVVTAIEDDQMGKDGGTTPIIQDTACAASACDHDTSQDWTVAGTYPGFGYSLEEVTVGAAEFEYDDSGTFYARHFAATADTEDPQTIMSGSTIASSEQVYACYRIAVTSSQQAGDYENLVTYTATGRF